MPSWFSEFGVEKNKGYLSGRKKNSWWPILPVMPGFFIVNIFFHFIFLEIWLFFSPWFCEINLHLRCIFWDLGSDETGIASLNRAPYASFCVCLLPPECSQIVSLVSAWQSTRKMLVHKCCHSHKRGKSDKRFSHLEKKIRSYCNCQFGSKNIC